MLIDNEEEESGGERIGGMVDAGGGWREEGKQKC